MHKTLSELKHIITLAESKKDKLTLSPLPCDRDDLSPVMSKEIIDYHYGTLAKGYVDRYNAGEGDADFNQAGAFLHNIFFAQLTSLNGTNRAFGTSDVFINKHYGDINSLKIAMSDAAMKIQGSGWVYLARDGAVKTIKNHQIKNDIIILIDCWEHSYNLDYLADKPKYLKNIWRIIDWKIINDRLNLEN